MASRRRWKFRLKTSLVFVCLLQSHLSDNNGVTNALSGASLSLFDRVRIAMKLSENGVLNITASEEACAKWDDILKCGETKQLLPSAVLLCLELHAACLVRIGNDEGALLVYDEALSLAENSQEGSFMHRLHLGKAKSLQRLLRYKGAFDQFILAGEEDGISGAITCAFRQGNLSAAKVHGVAAIKNVISFFSEKDENLEDLRAASVSSLLYRWLFCVAMESLQISKDPFPNGSWHDVPSFSFLDFCAINIGPFDDPMLVHLDDKVLLHRLLTSTPEIVDETKAFWPQGWAIESVNNLTDREKCFPFDSRSLFILKRRAGYGSHGNSIVKGWADVQDKITSFANKDDEQILVQRMVENPFLLPGGFKFSLRIYVTLVGDAVFLSDVGLVKLAAEAVGPDDISERSHMTNSGREKCMRQETLEYIKQQISAHELGGWNELYLSLQEATGKVFSIYKRLIENSSRTDIRTTQRMVSKLKIPKILGLDFVVDVDLQPWLVEINRFPGLEPRDQEQDAKVKQTIVRDAWQLAVSHSFRHPDCLGWLDRDFRSFSHDLPLRNSFSEVPLGPADGEDGYYRLQ